MANTMEPAPAHIPADRVVDIDMYDLPGAGEDVQLAWRRLQEKHDLVWTPHHGGHWIATGGHVIEMCFRRKDILSNREIGIPPGSMLIPMLPIQKDGEAHKAYRSIIEPAFRPSEVQNYAVGARDLTIRLIEGFRGRGSCEFISEYALILPLNIFLTMVDLPQEDREYLHGHAEVMTRTSDIGARHAAFGAIIAYLQRWNQRRREIPGGDLLSKVVHSQPFGQPATEEEVLGMGALLLFGGLDTVSSMMGFVMRFLATHPDHRRWIIDHPERLPFAIEEIMRRHGVANNLRTASENIEIDGVTVREGEHILVATCLHGLDAREFDNPLEVDFDRPAKWTATFGTGPHRCPGANLARTEIGILVEEWLARMPDFEIDPDRPLVQRSGGVNGILQLPLRWPTAAKMQPAARAHGFDQSLRLRSTEIPRRGRSTGR